MEKHQNKPGSDKETGKPNWNFLAALSARYFKRKLESEEEREPEDTFESDKVYQNVLDAIRQKQARVIRLKRSLVAAAAVLVCVVAGGYYYMNASHPVTMVERTTAKGEMAMITLADSSKVWLNADSKLRYPKDFKGNTREVHLTGEAYFEVAQLEKQPFIIHAGEIRTEVLGTSFDVRAYPGNRDAEVTVISGKVAVSAPKTGKNTLYVTPDQKAVYNKENAQLASFANIPAKESIDWKEGKMIFRRTAMKQVIEEVERKYNTHVISNEKINHCTITADFNNEELDKVMKVMARLIDGKVSLRNGIYYLEGNGCD